MSCHGCGLVTVAPVVLGSGTVLCTDCVVEACEAAPNAWLRARDVPRTEPIFVVD